MAIFFDFTQPSVINLVHAESQSILLDRLNIQQFYLFRLDGSSIFDKDSFFREMSNQILYPEFTNNWSSFEDLFWQLLFSSEHENTALIWTHVDNMLQRSLSDLIICSDILTSVSRTRYEKRMVHLNFFLGTNGNFLPIV